MAGSGKVPAGKMQQIVMSDSAFKLTSHLNSNEKTKKRQREEKGDPSTVHGCKAYKGPWAYFEVLEPTGDDDYETVEVIEKDVEVDEAEDLQLTKKLKTKLAWEVEAQVISSTKDVDEDVETSDFLGSEQFDYQGRTYMHIPRNEAVNLTHDSTSIKNFVPKKCIYTWQPGHTKAITGLKLFPSSGHLLLSASADSQILLWDVYRQKELLRSYHGHTQGITAIDFNPLGTTFLSASHDGSIKQWDTETGACISRFGKSTPGSKTPYVVQHKPDSAHEFLAGVGKSILQYDARSSPTIPVVEYGDHTGSINTISFYGSSSNGPRFASTSDDCSIRLWDYRLPVTTKLIDSPELFPITRSAVHPSGKYICFQSANNKIEAYTTGENNFRSKKSYRGHQTAGYGIDVACSPDGRIVASGDSRGLVCFWDFGTGRLRTKIPAHETACTRVAWLPKETSKVVTGGNDGSIHLWD